MDKVSHVKFNFENLFFGGKYQQYSTIQRWARVDLTTIHVKNMDFISHLVNTSQYYA